MVFAEAQTEPSTAFGTTADGGAPVRFETYDDALDWARQNPGRPITRSSDGSGFVAK
jgi:hypothetical protein